MLFAGDFRFLLIDESILNYRRYVSPRHPFAFLRLDFIYGMDAI